MGRSVRGSAQVGQQEVRRPPSEPGAPNPCSFPHRKEQRGAHSPTGTGMGKREGFGQRRGPEEPRGCAARHGNLEQRRCLKQKPAYRTPRAPRSRSQRQTLMYRCPISAFNWCPLGQATWELRRRELSRQALPARSQGNRKIMRPGGRKAASLSLRGGAGKRPSKPEANCLQTSRRGSVSEDTSVPRQGGMWGVAAPTFIPTPAINAALPADCRGGSPAWKRRCLTHTARSFQFG